MRIHFSIKAMLIITALVAAGCASILYPSYGLAAVLLLAAILLVLTSIAAAIVLRGPAQAYWIGAAVFGGSYLFLVLFCDRVVPNQTNSTYSYALPTTNLIVWSYLKANGDAQASQITIGSPWISVDGFGSGGFGSGGFGSFFPTFFTGAFGLQRPPIMNATVGGNSLFTALFALLGGWIAARLGRRRQETPAAANNTCLADARVMQ